MEEKLHDKLETKGIKQIYNKSISIRGFLEPFTTSANLAYLKRAGFKDVMSIMKYTFFEGFLAIK